MNRYRHRVRWALGGLFVAAATAVVATRGYRVAMSDGGSVALPCEISGSALLSFVRVPPGGASLADEGVRVYENGVVKFAADFPGSAPSMLTLVARGTSAAGEWPYLLVRIDHRETDGFFVTSEEWARYRVPLDLSAGRHVVELAYINDRLLPGEDRNVDLMRLVLGSVADHAETAEWVRFKAPGSVEATLFARRSFALPKGDAMEVWTGGWIAEDVCFETAGSYRLRAMVAADFGGQGGQLEVFLDDRPAGSVEVAARPAEKTMAFRAGQGFCRLKLRYRAGEGRIGAALVIGRVSIDAVP